MCYILSAALVRPTWSLTTGLAPRPLGLLLSGKKIVLEYEWHEYTALLGGYAPYDMREALLSILDLSF